MAYCSKCGSDLQGNVYCSNCGMGPGAPSGGIAGPASTSGAQGKSLAGAVSMMVLGGAAAVATWLPFLTDPYEDISINGWDTASFLKDMDQFSFGVTLTLVTGLITFALGLLTLISKNNGNGVNKPVVGGGVLGAGIVMLLSIGGTYNAADSALNDLGATANQGIGMWLAAVLSLGITVLGVIALAVPKVTQSISN